MNLLFMTFILLYSLQSQSMAHHKGKVSSINVGTRFSSVLQKRGVIFYKDYQFDPIIAVFLFDDRLEYLGDSIGFRDFIFQDKIRLRSRFVAISDKPLFPNHRPIFDSSPHRKDTYEWSQSLEFFLPGYNKNYRSEWDLTFAKDIGRHYGHYAELLGKVKVGNLNLLKTELEPNIFSSVGWGDGLHNQYFYGPDVKKSGLNNLSLGLWIVLPHEADRFYPIIQLAHFQSLASFREGEYSHERNEGFLFSFIATYGLLDR
jgi:hypothetical protein